MQEKDYTNYSAEQLLEDDFFRESFFAPTGESQSFWKEWMEKDEGLAEEIIRAHTILRSVPYRQRVLAPDQKELLWKRIRATSHKKRLFRYWYSSAAAVAALLLAIGGFYYSNDDLTAIEKVQRPEQPAETIQLILANEKKVEIADEEARLQYSKKGELHINTQKVKTHQSAANANKKKTPVYNQLIVPAAKRSFLELADGSRIWVNANTRVVYPVTFEDEKREIYVDGEIYIEVSPDKERPFTVKSKKMDIRVLGTKFNVSAYEEREVSVVLVSGKVNVRTDNRTESVLEPSDRLAYEKGAVDIQKVNVENYISWKDGFYTFDNECFSVVLEKLSAYYGKKISYGPEAGALRCSGSLNLGEDMVKVLTGLESTMPVAFTIEGECISVSVKPLNE